MFGDAVGQIGDAVDDQERVADEGGLNRGGTAGDHAGTGVVKGLAGVGDWGDVGVGVGTGQEALHECGVEGGGDGEEELARLLVVDETGCGDHLGEVEADLLGAAAGEQGDPGEIGVEVVADGVVGARDGWKGQFGKGVTDEVGGDVARAVEVLLEGEDDEHAIDALLNPTEASSLPGPELGANEVDDGDAALLEFSGEAEVDVGEVDEDGDVGFLLADGADEFAILAVDIGGVTEDFGDAHVGDVFGAYDSLLSGGLHLGAAEAEEAGVRVAAGELLDDLGTVVVAGGFAGGDEDTWGGVAYGAHSVVPPPPRQKCAKSSNQRISVRTWNVRVVLKQLALVDREGSDAVRWYLVCQAG